MGNEVGLLLLSLGSTLSRRQCLQNTGPKGGEFGNHTCPVGKVREEHLTT
jgi:hypothetical protein